MVNTGSEDWKITQIHHYNEPSFLRANITLDPFSDKTDAENQVILDQLKENKDTLL